MGWQMAVPVRATAEVEGKREGHGAVQKRVQIENDKGEL